MKRPARMYRHGGFSLVELMVAITIGLVIMAAVSVLFVDTQKSYRSQNNVARIQENGRFALSYLIRDTRMAGYFGCQSSRADSTVTAHSPNITLKGMPATGTVPYPFNLAVPVEGFDGDRGMTQFAPSSAAAPAGIVAGTDAIAIRMADPSTLTYLSAPMAKAWDPLPVNSTQGYKPNDIVLVSDCASMDLTQITGIGASPPTLDHAAGGSVSGNVFAPGNQVGRLAKAYGDPSTVDDLRAVKVMKEITRRYYIRNNADSIPCLYMDDNGGTPVELVEGIEDMQILYGVDQDTSTPGIDHYIHADEVTDWSRVRSIRIGLLARTPGATEAEYDTNTYQVNDVTRTFTTADKDRNRRRVFLATILLRNDNLTL